MKGIEGYISLAENAVGSVVLPKCPAGLYEPIEYGLSNGGKRLRPALLLAACDAVGGDCSAALNQAVAVAARRCDGQCRYAQGQAYCLPEMG